MQEAGAKEKKPGWWILLSARGTLDTDKFFIICSNVLGGKGIQAPLLSILEQGTICLDFPSSREGYGGRPEEAPRALGIDKLFAVIGGSFGGMQFCNVRIYPEAIASHPIATSAIPRPADCLQ